MEKQTASPRSKFLSRFSDKELASVVWDVLKLASSHDPDHEKEISRISKKLERLELERLELETKTMSRDVHFYNELVDRIKIAESIANRRDPKHEKEIRGISKKLGRLELVTANETNSIADIFIDLYKRVKAIECTIKK